MSLTKGNLVESIYIQCGQSKPISVIIVESLLEIMKKTLESGEDVMITGFGKFCVKEKGDRKGRNPQTGDNMMLRPRRIVVFKCSGVLREGCNERESKIWLPF
ncbi:MAG: integration host factor subunit alpha [Deltaproteobacteria bacterium]|nr:integration host factor subunit alpha [Deltaproteobacteria bacterium]